MKGVLFNMERFDTATRDQQVARFMAKTYWLMIAGLLVTAATSYVPTLSSTVFTLLYGVDGAAPIGIIVLGIVMFVLTMVITARIDKMSFTVAFVAYAAFAAVTGLFISAIHLVYDPTIIMAAFFATVIIFAIMAIYGTVTKTDLTRIGALCFFALIGVILTSIMNWFLGSDLLDYVICWAVVAIFLGIIAYDAQKLRDYAAKGDNYCIYGALAFHLDFVNVFLRLVRILGTRGSSSSSSRK